MPGYIDLHMHTRASDGVLSASQLLEIVRKKKLVAFSVTDHDTLNGYREVSKLRREDDPELISGVELSVVAEDQDMHLLAYCFDPESEVLNHGLERFQQERSHRGRLMVEKLNKLGMTLLFSDVEETAGNSAIGRPHVAEAMVNRGFVSTVEEAFYRYIGNGRPAYLPKSKLTPREGIRFVHQARGVAVLAHPMIAQMNKHIEQLVEWGLDGVEAYHYSHKKKDVQELKRVAERFGLVVTGGSDFHGRSSREGAIGSQQIPSRLLDTLKQRAKQIWDNA